MLEFDVVGLMFDVSDFTSNIKHQTSNTKHQTLMLTRRGFESRNRIRRGLEGPELDALGHAVHAVNGRHESEDRSRDGVRIDASAQ